MHVTGEDAGATPGGYGSGWSTRRTYGALSVGSGCLIPDNSDYRHLDSGFSMPHTGHLTLLAAPARRGEVPRCGTKTAAPLSPGCHVRKNFPYCPPPSALCPLPSDSRLPTRYPGEDRGAGRPTPQACRSARSSGGRCGREPTGKRLGVFRPDPEASPRGLR